MAGSITIKKSWLVVAVLVYAIGIGSGALIQKYYKYYLVENLIKTKDEFSRKKIDCAKIPAEGRMVALTFGQSNAANFGETPWISGPSVYNYNGGKCYIAQDPLLGADGTGGSAWGRMGDKFIANNLYKNVVIVSIAVGGTQIERWTVGGDLHHKITDAIADARKVGFEFTHLIWHQGEMDATLNTPREAYKKMFHAMLADIRDQGVNAPIFVAVASRCRQVRGAPEVQAAQRELVDPTQNIFAGPNTDELGLEYRWDGCHFSTEGLDLHAQRWFDVIHNYDVEHATTPSTKTLAPKS